jgi:hypothetical protein
MDSLSSYLANRRQVVSLDGASSAQRGIAHGVPQGSVLGPLLFSIMINDLWLNGRTLLFADDTTLITRGLNINQLQLEANILLERAKDWFISNCLKINEDKTQSLMCSLGTEAPKEEPVKLLGFWLDGRLSWNHHISKVCVTLSRVLYLLRKLKMMITLPYLMTVYHALFQSHVIYGLVLWGHSPAARDVLLLQKRALRVITSSGNREHCRPIFKELKVLTVFSQYVLNSLVLLKDNVAQYVKREDQHCYNTRRAQDLDVPRSRLSHTQRCFPISAIKIFNTLPESVRALNSKTFKTVLRDRLLERPLYALEELSNEPLFGCLKPPPSCI